jgi:threonine aldolase
MIDLANDAPRPTREMVRAMAAAVDEDPDRHDTLAGELEELVASLAGKEAALFLPTGTMANEIAYFVQCSAGDEVLLFEDAHATFAENAGPAVHSRVSLRPLRGRRGVFTGSQVEEAVHARLDSRPRSRLVSVENPQYRGGWGTLWSLAEIQDVERAARAKGLAMHLDGARLMHAVVATGVSLSDYCAPFDSAWISLTKALGGVGTVLVGSAAFIEEARWARHLFGGEIYHPGMQAAAGMYALRHHVERLADDHEHARRLASAMSELAGIEVDLESVQTNIVPFTLTTGSAAAFAEQLLSRGVRMHPVGRTSLIAATCYDADIGRLSEVVAAVEETLATVGAGSRVG